MCFANSFVVVIISVNAIPIRKAHRFNVVTSINYLGLGLQMAPHNSLVAYLSDLIMMGRMFKDNHKFCVHVFFFFNFQPREEELDEDENIDPQKAIEKLGEMNKQQEELNKEKAKNFEKLAALKGVFQRYSSRNGIKSFSFSNLFKLENLPAPETVKTLILDKSEN